MKNDDLADILMEYIESNWDSMVKEWIEARDSLDSGVYRELPENDVVSGSESFLRMFVDILSEDDDEDIERILRRELEVTIEKRVNQGVSLEFLLQGSKLHRDIIFNHLQHSDLYSDLPDNRKLELRLFLFNRFEQVQDLIAKIAHKTAVAEIDRLHKFNENIVLSVSEGIIIEDKNGMIIYANPKYLNLLGYEKDEIVGHHWERTIPRDQLRKFREESSKRRLGIDGKYEGLLQNKKGERIPVLISARTLHEHGKFNGVLAVITDIKEMKRMENALRQSKEELERLNAELEEYSKKLEEDNIRLRKTLNIKPVEEEQMEDEEIYSLDPGYLYLLTTEGSEKSFRVFEDLVKHKHKGLCVTRTLPKTVREKYSLEKTPIIWLTTNKVADTHCISPSNIVDLSSALIKFMERTDNGVIILEGIEYLISQNNFRSILNLIQLLNDKVMLCDCKILIPLDTEVIEPKELHLIKKETKPFEEEIDVPDIHNIAMEK